VTLLENLQTSLADRYRIEREIGVGGMATVYLAHDLRHDRDVALKVLKPELGAVLGPGRFLSEIRVTAKLQHPNLLPLFDSGESDGQLWYVMPHVEGESLRARMNRERQLSVREAVRITTLVAGALDYAHRHGVIHRDLKPENILLSEDQPLVADFGIALAVSHAGGERVTQTGLSLGTPQYMSPEQATGERGVDGRTDIYSLGAVLYEMLTGEPPHTGATVQAIIARLMTDTPRSIRATRSSVPEYVDWAVQKALEKIPADRFETAKEFAETLQGQKAITASRTAAFVTPHETAALALPRTRDAKLPWIVAGVATALAIAAALGWIRARKNLSGDSEPVSFTVTPAAGESFNTTFLAVSPDGRRIVYSGDNEKGSWLYSRTMDDVDSHLIPGSEGAEIPFFSPDGKWLAFFAAGNLVRVPIEGGAAITIVRNVIPKAAWWTQGNRIIIPTQAVTRQRAGLSEVSPSGGVPKVLFASDTVHRENMRGGYDLPDGDHFIFASLGPGGFEDDNLAIGSLKSKDYKVLDFLVSEVLGFLEGNAIVTQFDGTQWTIVAVPMDLRGRKVTGDPITLRSGVMTAYGVALSQSGTLAYVSGASGAQLVWLDQSGKTDTLLAEVRGYSEPRVSPDGSRIALLLPGRTEGDIWVYNVGGKTLSRLTNGSATWPEWTPDGNRIVFVRSTTATAGIYVQPADGSAEAQRLKVTLPPRVIPVWAGMSPDQSTILFSAATGAQRQNIYYFKPGVDDVAKPWLATDSDESEPRFSPDGKWVAYASDESGSTGLEVYVRPFLGPGPRVQISSGGGHEPVWSHDGRKIFYRNGGRVMAAELASSPTLSVTARRPVLSMGAPGSEVGANYDISPDGNRILIGKPAGREEKLTVVANWFTEVRRKLKEAGQK
jgi:serine/threonine-protein kinase